MTKYSTKMLHHDIELINNRIRTENNNPYNLIREQRSKITISWQTSPKIIGSQITVSVNNEEIFIDIFCQKTHGFNREMNDVYNFYDSAILTIVSKCDTIYLTPESEVKA